MSTILPGNQESAALALDGGMYGLLARRQGMMAVEPPPDYIQDGLVFHLDGADATASQWVDRVGNIAFALTNTTLDGNGGVVFNGSAYGNYPYTLDFPSSTHTIEVVLNKTETFGGLQVAFMINVSDKVAFGFGSDGKFIVTKSGNSNSRATWYTDSGLATYSVTNSNAYKDCAHMPRRSSDTWFLRTGGTFVGSRSADNAFFKGTIYQIRIYNRALTQQEIIYNQTIDMQRYNI